MTTLDQIAAARSRIHTPKRFNDMLQATRPQPMPRSPLEALCAARIWRR